MRRIQKYMQPFAEFIKNKVSSGILLLFTVCVALFMYNSQWRETLHHIFELEMGIKIADEYFVRDMHFWINDGLMAIFFLLVGLEIKREFLEGELADLKKSTLPIFGAIGGMLVPALLYFIINFGKDSQNGWGIPMATDIAFAVAILSMLGKRVPLGIKIFLTALAIVDDLGAIVVIALFYTQNLQSDYLFLASIVLILLYILNISQVVNLLYYLPLGAILWYLIYKSGIHATIAGVLLAFFIPTNKGNQISPLEYLEFTLHKPVGYIIMPLFALSNTDIILQSESFVKLIQPASIGIFVGLVFGKVMGIVSFAWFSIRIGWAKMPSKSTLRHLIGAGFLGGIGFTMSIFISLLSFSQPEYQSISKLSILISSLVAGLVGFVVLATGTKLDEKDVLTSVRQH